MTTSRITALLAAGALAALPSAAAAKKPDQTTKKTEHAAEHVGKGKAKAKKPKTRTVRLTGVVKLVEGDVVTVTVGTRNGDANKAGRGFLGHDVRLQVDGDLSALKVGDRVAALFKLGASDAQPFRAKHLEVKAADEAGEEVEQD